MTFLFRTGSHSCSNGWQYFFEWIARAVQKGTRSLENPFTTMRVISCSTKFAGFVFASRNALRLAMGLKTTSVFKERKHAFRENEKKKMGKLVRSFKLILSQNVHFSIILKTIFCKIGSHAALGESC